jgi:hypothetical protein
MAITLAFGVVKNQLKLVKLPAEASVTVCVKKASTFYIKRLRQRACRKRIVYL